MCLPLSRSIIDLLCPLGGVEGSLVEGSIVDMSIIVEESTLCLGCTFFCFKKKIDLGLCHSISYIIVVLLLVFDLI